MSNHTPGPWVTNDDTLIMTRDGNTVCCVESALPYEEELANAALISKAPQMYEMLKLWAKTGQLGSHLAKLLIEEIDGETK